MAAGYTFLLADKPRKGRMPWPQASPCCQPPQPWPLNLPSTKPVGKGTIHAALPQIRPFRAQYGNLEKAAFAGFLLY
jgi:hypothetical protein